MKNKTRFMGLLASLALALAVVSTQAQTPVSLLNVSYDPTRELYAEFNQAFGSWEQVGQEHFADGGIFDQIYTRP